MKNILIFSLAYYPHHVSGAEAAIKEITERIDRDDITFHMVTLQFDRSDERHERIGNVEVYRVGFGSLYLSKVLFPLLAALKARQLNKQYRFNALWGMMTYMLFPIVLLRLMGTKIHHILTLQDGDPYEKVFERWFILPVAPLLNYGFRSASMIQVISTFLGTWPKKRGYEGPVELVHNGANPRDILGERDEEAVKALHRTIGKKEGDIILTNTARLVHQKGFDTTVHALPMLPDNVKLVIVGDGDKRQMVEDLVDELNLRDRVVFIGKVDRSEVTLYRHAADIFVGPSRSEGLGNAFLSAMASRLPVVATQEGGIAEFLSDATRNPDKKTTGWAVDPDNPEQIADAVKDILANPDKVKEVTENARAMVLAEYNWDAVAVTMKKKVFDPVITKA